MIEEGGEGMEQDNRELSRIVAYNDMRMGLKTGKDKQEGAKLKLIGSSDVTEETFGNDIHICRSRTYPKEVFVVLKEFWDSSVLTDLTLSTGSGNSFNVHSVILAAVSGFVLERLRDKPEDDHTGVHKWSIHMGTEVDGVGLQAVMEFAYTGVVLSLNKDTVAHIKAAAQVLVVPRLVELCNKVERIKEGLEKEMFSELEQIKTTLQAIEQLRVDGVGCDVTLDLDGTFLHG